MTTNKRLYRCLYADGSEDIVEAYDINDAKSEAESNYDRPIKKITVIFNDSIAPGDGQETSS